MRLSHFGPVLALLCAPLFSQVAPAADLPPGHPPVSTGDQAADTTLKHAGTIKESLPAGPYVYLHVDGDNGDEWLAAPAFAAEVGTRIRWNEGSVMRNWQSKALNRTFDSVRLVEVVQLATP